MISSATRFHTVFRRVRASYETVPSPQGNGSIRGLLVRPASAGTSRLPAVLVVHENRGLNPHIEDVARRLAVENVMAFAPDGLTSVGGYPGAGHGFNNAATPPRYNKEAAELAWKRTVAWFNKYVRAAS